MKRFGMIMAVAMCLCTATFAADDKSNDANWYENINVDKLSRYLNLTADQHQEVSSICDLFGNRMSRAGKAKKNQDKLVRRAVNSHLKMMWVTLNDKQYADYKRLLEVTLDNKGIELK